MGVGFSFPFRQATGSLGLFEMTNTELQAVQQNVRVLAMTNWGERPMHYQFGFNFREFLFEQARDEDLKARMADRVIDQLQKWMPFLVLDNLNLIFSSDDVSLNENEVRVIINYHLKNKPDLVGQFDETIVQ